MGKRGRKATVISRLRDIRSSSYRGGSGLPSMSAGTLEPESVLESAAVIFAVIWFVLGCYSSSAKTSEEMEGAAVFSRAMCVML